MTSKFSKSLGTIAVSWLLILQIAIGSTLMTMRHAMAAPGDQDGIAEELIREGSKDPVTAEGREKAEAFMSEVENAGPNDLPKGTVDAFHLTGQTLEILKGKGAGVYDLSTLNIDLPSVVADFDKEIKIETSREAKTLSIVYTKKGEVVARHTLSGLDVVAFARDREMLQFVDANGKMLVMDMVFARGTAFKAPLPVFEVGALPEHVLSSIDIGNHPYRDIPDSSGKKIIEKIQVAFANRGVKPVDVVPDHAVLPNDVAARDYWTAGDFLVFFENSQGMRELVGVYNRGVSQMQMYTGNAVLSFLATMVNPPEKDASIKGATAPLADPMVATQAKAVSGQLDAVTRDALAAFPEATVEKLRVRSAANKVRASAERDRYEYMEWSKDFKSLQDRAKSEAASEKDATKRAELEKQISEGDLGSRWQEHVKDALGSGEQKRGVIYRVMTHKAMKYLALFAGGYLAVKGVGQFVGMDLTPEASRPLAWAVHSANWLYANIWPNVLKDAAYRVTLFKSFFALSMFIPALHVVGMVYGKMKGWQAMKAKATLGIRAYAAIQLPFWVRLARVAIQPNLMPSLQMGVNPLGKISKDSELGKKLGLSEDIRPGINGWGKKGEQDAKIKRKALEAIAVQKNRLRAYSFLLANLVVGERHGIDPATMLTARSGKFAGAKVSEVLNDPAFAKEWLHTAHELATVMQDVKKGAVIADITELSMEQVLEDYAQAKRTAEEINSRSAVKKVAQTLKTHWNEFGSRFMKAFGRYGIEENNFLKVVEPSDRVVRDSWQQFFMDYSLAVYQMGLFGERAKMDLPEKLAASENGILYTNRGHFTDMVDQAVRAYGLQNPADLALVFQKDPQVTEGKYEPKENLTMEGASRTDSFIKGMLSWTKSVLSLREANYGGLYMKSFIKKFKTLQASIILSFGARLGLAGQTFAQAATGYGFLYFVGMPGYAWPWYQTMQGNEGYTGKIEAANRLFMDAKVDTAQGLRLDDKAKIDKGYEKLVEIFTTSYKDDLPKELRQGVKFAEDFLKLPPEQQIAESKAINKFYGETARLSLAIESGDSVKIIEAYSDLIKQYNGETSQYLKEMNARSLLDFALKNPPIATKAHPLITWTATALASVSTTWLATALFATSYGGEMTFGLFLSGVKFAAEFYGGTFLAQKVINKLGERLDYIKQFDKTVEAKLNGTFKPEVKTVPVSFEEYRRAYVEEKAKEYRVDTRDIEAVMDKTLEDALRIRHEAELKSSKCEVMLTSAEAIKPLTFGQKAKILLKGAPRN